MKMLPLARKVRWQISSITFLTQISQHNWQEIRFQIYEFAKRFKVWRERVRGSSWPLALFWRVWWSYWQIIFRDHRHSQNRQKWFPLHAKTNQQEQNLCVVVLCKPHTLVAIYGPKYAAGSEPNKTQMTITNYHANWEQKWRRFRLLPWFKCCANICFNFETSRNQRQQKQWIQQI